MKELTLEARRENLDEVIAFLDGSLEELSCSMKLVMQMELAVEEIFINIASYAYVPAVGNATIRIESEKDPAAVRVTFEDQGMQYDPLAKADPDITLSAEERRIGGLGVFMVKKSMDDMQYTYRDGKNILSIMKKL